MYFCRLLYVIFALFFIFGCGTLTPRSNSIFPLDFSAQKPRALIRATCNGNFSIHEGGFVCEERTPRQAKIEVKIMPVPGRIVFSDGLQKEVEDFNWLDEGFWIWKRKRISDTWVPLELGELNSIYGDVPVAFDVIGYTEDGVIVNRGLIYYSICNDQDIPCSKLIIHYDCNGKIKNTYKGQLGFCNRMSGSSQKLKLSLNSTYYNLKEGAILKVISGRSNWQFTHEVTADDIKVGEVKFIYPNVMDGPELFRAVVVQKEQGIWVEYHTQIVINGFNAKWTGIDKPHWYKKGSQSYKICAPVTSDLLEVVMGKERKISRGGCISWKKAITSTICAYAYDRESSDRTHLCITPKMAR